MQSPVLFTGGHAKATIQRPLCSKAAVQSQLQFKGLAIQRLHHPGAGPFKGSATQKPPLKSRPNERLRRSQASTQRPAASAGHCSMASSPKAAIQRPCSSKAAIQSLLSKGRHSKPALFTGPAMQRPRHSKAAPRTGRPNHRPRRSKAPPFKGCAIRLHHSVVKGHASLRPIFRGHAAQRPRCSKAALFKGTLSTATLFKGHAIHRPHS